MRVTVVRPSELGKPEAALWAGFQRTWQSTAKPFFALAFARAVGAERPDARVAVVEDAGRIEAFLPFEPGPRGFGRPIGWPMNDLHGLVSSGAPLDLHAVVRGAGLHAWRFEHAPAEQQLLAPHGYAGTELICPVIDVSAGYHAYFDVVAGRGRSLVTKSPKQRHALERRLGEVSLEWHSADPAELGRLITWKSGRYERSRQEFAQRSTVAVLERLAASRDPQCAGKLSVLRAGDRRVAVDLGLCGEEDLCGWFTGYDPDLSAYSPGTMMLLALAEAAGKEGLQRFDLGYGQHRYKFSLANSGYPLTGGVVWARRSEALARRAYRRVLFDPLVRRRQSRRSAPSSGPDGL